MSIFGKNGPAIFHNHSDTLAAQAHVQDGAKGKVRWAATNSLLL
jgi:hypothetical protein